MLYDLWNALIGQWNDNDNTRMVEEYERLESKHCIVNDFHEKYGVYL